MPKHDQKLPRKEKPPVKHWTQNIPLELWKRMLDEAGLGWGEVTQYINQAITEKLDREKEEEAAEDAEPEIAGRR